MTTWHPRANYCQGRPGLKWRPETDGGASGITPRGGSNRGNVARIAKEARRERRKNGEAKRAVYRKKEGEPKKETGKEGEVKKEMQ